MDQQWKRAGKGSGRTQKGLRGVKISAPGASAWRKILEKTKASLKIPALQENQDIPTLPSTTFPRAGQAQEVK